MDLKDKLLVEFEKTFGERNPITSRFGSTSLGEIADQLCLSNSLLTKLISGTATQGMYERCLKNLARVNKEIELREKADKLNAQKEQLASEIQTNQTTHGKRKKLLILVSTLLSLLGLYTVLGPLNKGQVPDQPIQENFLQKFFNPEFNVPSFSAYVPNNKVQDYCPCSAFEGDWSLNKPYTIPIPFKNPGLYYVAKSSDIKLKCSSSDKTNKQGTKMHGFEIMKHELWMDSQQESLVPRFFDKETKQFTKDFFNIKFQEDGRFDKVAEITSFFYNSIYINDETIIRHGEPCGRYTSEMNEEAISKYEIDLKEILNHVVGDMIKVQCPSIPNPYCNPNSLIEGESLLEFKCHFSISTENLGIGGNYPYTKGFKLIDQNYSHNMLCSCNDPLEEQ